MTSHRTLVSAFSVLLLALPATPALAQSFEVAARVVALPDGPASVGGLSEDISTNLSMGQASYRVELPLVAGEADFAPTLALTYDSGAPNGDLGLQWSHGLPQICRDDRRGLPQYGEPDRGDDFKISGWLASGRFARLGASFVLEGNAVALEAQVGGQRAADGWEVELASGQVAVFGTSPESREGRAAGGFGETYCWLVDRIEDRYGHTIRYEYESSVGLSRLVAIHYATSTEAPREVRFLYEARDDVHENYRRGYRYTHETRVAAIEMLAGDGDRVRTVWVADLAYKPDYGGSRLEGFAIRGEADGEQLAYAFEYAPYVPEQIGQAIRFDAIAVDPGAGTQRLVDIDADGLVDLLEGASDRWYVRRNRHGAGFGEREQLFGIGGRLDDPSPEEFLDVDGDGRVDIVRRVGDHPVAWVNRSTVDALRFDGPVELAGVAGDHVFDPSALRFDIDGDGRTDILADVGGTLTAFLTGGEDRHENVLGFPGYATAIDGVLGGQSLDRADLDDGTFSVADTNGDRLDDLVRAMGGPTHTDALVVYANRGDGSFAPARPLDVPAQVTDVPPESLVAQDLNGDGLADLYSRNGATFRFWLNLDGTRFDRGHALQIEQQGTEGTVVVRDVNGDNFADVVSIAPDGDGWSVYSLASEVPLGLLTSATNALGAERRFHYQTLAHARLAAANEVPWTSTVPIPMWVVESMEVDPGTSATIVESYSYVDPRWDLLDAELIGFRATRTVRHGDSSAASSVVDTHYYLGHGDEPSPLGTGLGIDAPELVDAVGARGAVQAELVSTEEGILLRAELHEFAVVAESPHAPVLESRTLIAHVEGELPTPKLGELPDLRNASGIRLTGSEISYDEFGNATTIRDYGVVDTNFADVQDPPRVVERDYVQSSNPALSRLVCEERVLGSDGSVQARTRYRYDDEPHCSAALGERVATERFLDVEARWVTESRLEYDVHGNVVRIMDATGGERSFTYDPILSAFAIQESIATGVGTELTYNAEYDLARGAIVMFEEPTGVAHELEYDGLGRIVTSSMTHAGRVAFVVDYEYELETQLPRVVTTRTAPRGEAQVSVQLLDRLGRSLGNAMLNSAVGEWIVSNYVSFGVLGNPARTYAPFTVRALDGALTPDETPVRATQTDALGRIIALRYADGTAERIVYRPTETLRFDANDLDPTSPHADTPRVERYDGHGFLVELVEQTTSSASIHTFEADVFGNTTAYNDPLGTRRTWEFDSLNRVVAVRDANAGTLLMRYDDAGRLVEHSNDAGGAERFEHDDAGRLLRHWTRQSIDDDYVISSEYTYDELCDGVVDAASDFGRGRVTAELHGDVRICRGYDVAGNEVEIRATWRDRTFRTTRSYDGYGRLRRRAFADGSSLLIDYDALGRVASIPGFVDRVEYDASSIPVEVRYANGSRTVYGYDQRNRPDSIHVRDAGGGSVFHVERVLDAAGIPTANVDHVRPDGATSHAAAYVHDALYRPTMIERPGVGRVHYRYDDANNLLSRSVDEVRGDSGRLLNRGEFAIGARRGDSVAPYLVQSATGLAYEYDAAGRVSRRHIDGVEYELGWDGIGRLQRVASPSSTTLSTYTSRDRLIAERRIESGLTTDTLWLDSANRVACNEDGCELVKTIAVGDLRIARSTVESFIPGTDSASFEDGWDQRLSEPAPARRVDRDVPALLLTLLMVLAISEWNRRRRWLALLGAASIIGAVIGGCAGPAASISDTQSFGGDVRFQHHTFDGTIAVETDEAGYLVRAVAYSDEGLLLGEQGSSLDFRDDFAGGVLDRTTDTVAVGIRHYDPHMGRWTAVDPAVLSINMGHLQAGELGGLSYVANRFTNAVDLTGFSLDPATATLQFELRGYFDVSVLSGEYSHQWTLNRMSGRFVHDVERQLGLGDDLFKARVGLQLSVRYGDVDPQDSGDFQGKLTGKLPPIPVFGPVMAKFSGTLAFDFDLDAATPQDMFSVKYIEASGALEVSRKLFRRGIPDSWVDMIPEELHGPIDTIVNDNGSEADGELTGSELLEFSKMVGEKLWNLMEAAPRLERLMQRFIDSEDGQ